MTVFASPRAARARQALLILALSLALGGTAAHAGGLAPDLARRLQADPQSFRPARVIARFSTPEIDDETLCKSFGGRKLARLGLLNGGALELPERLLKLLSKRADVLHVSPDRKLEACWDQDTAAIHADQIWPATGVRGSGPRVAVLDTGVYKPNDDLNRWGAPGSRVVAWKNLVNGHATPYDDNGHGSHVAGVALGSGTQSALPGRGYGFFSGVAPVAELVTGTAALILSANESLTPNAVKALLMYTAQRLRLRDAQGQLLSPGLSILTRGAGSLNAAGAVEMASGVDG